MGARTLALVGVVLGALAGGLPIAAPDLGLSPGITGAVVFVLTTLATALGYRTPNSDHRALEAMVADRKDGAP